MPKSRHHIFLALPRPTVLSIRLEGQPIINTRPCTDPPTHANYELPQTYRQALKELREMKAQIRHTQAQDIPFEQRIRLFRAWKKLLKLEKEWQRNLHD